MLGLPTRPPPRLRMELYGPSLNRMLYGLLEIEFDLTWRSWTPLLAGRRLGGAQPASSLSGFSQRQRHPDRVVINLSSTTETLGKRLDLLFPQSPLSLLWAQPTGPPKPIPASLSWLRQSRLMPSDILFAGYGGHRLIAPGRGHGSLPLPGCRPRVAPAPAIWP